MGVRRYGTAAALSDISTGRDGSLGHGSVLLFGAMLVSSLSGGRPYWAGAGVCARVGLISVRTRITWTRIAESRAIDVPRRTPATASDSQCAAR